MARDGAVYICQSCGAAQTKWAGQCPACNAWNSLVEEVTSRPPGALAPTKASKTRGLNFETLETETAAPPRIVTGVDEFDRVCGGGVVPGSAILLRLSAARRAPTSPARKPSNRFARAPPAWAWPTPR